MQGLDQPDTNRNCPLCEQPAYYHSLSIDYGRTLQIECDRCGRFTISMEALRALIPEKRYLLSSVCRTWQGDSIPRILASNMEALINRAPRRTVPEKRDFLLELMAQKTDAPGSISGFDALKDYPLLTAREAKETHWLLKSLADEGLISLFGTTQGVVTMAGWVRAGQLRQAGPNSAFAFIAMSFSNSMSDLYDKAIAPAVRQAGYEPIRVDRKEHVNSIDDEIVGSIRRSRFMVADFTEQRSGVYFEAGMMMGLGRNVIWLCDKRELGAVHFDVRQRNFIDWDSVEDARQRLYKRILAIEGEGPNLGVSAAL